jgi:hypothetical protein
MLPGDGYLMVDGVRIPVVGVSLARGKTTLHGQKRGPLAASAPGARALTVFGADGIGICQGYTSASWPELGFLDVLDLNVDMSMTTCYGDAEVPGGQEGS